MKIVKIILLNLMFFSYLNAGIILDFDKRKCENNCEAGDDKCDVEQKTCEILVPLFWDTIDAEFVKTFTHYAGSAFFTTGQKLAEAGIVKTPKGFYTKGFYALGRNTRYIGAMFKKNGPLWKQWKDHKLDKTALVTIALDIMFDIVSTQIIDHYDHEECSKIRAIPGIHDNASDDTIRQALKWVVKLGYNDLKATIYYSQGNYIASAGAGVVDNTLLLADIGLKTAGAAQGYFESATALAMSKKRGEILALYWKYAGPYIRVKEENSDLKTRTLNKFLTECKKIQLDLSEKAIANWSKPLIGLGAQLNLELNDYCYKYYWQMQRDNFNKYKMLTGALITYPKYRFDKFIEYYFHQDDWSYYKKLYDITNYDPEISFSKNSAQYKYVKKLYAYGTNFRSRFASNASKDASMINATIGIANVLSKHYKIKRSIYQIAAAAGYTLKTKLTRKVYGKLLYENFNIRYVGFDHDQMATFKQLEKKRTSAEATLAAFKIIPGYRSTSKYNIFANKPVKSYTLVQMLADTLDVVTCGHKGCSYEEILKDAK